MECRQNPCCKWFNGNDRRVLILVLMECRQNSDLEEGDMVKIESLNPCSNGMSPKLQLWHRKKQESSVLILVLMECRQNTVGEYDDFEETLS